SRRLMVRAPPVSPLFPYTTLFRSYYGGCRFVDIAEELAIERAKKLFSCNFANVQPNSGSQMNQAVFLALLKPGDTFMGLDLNSRSEEHTSELQSRENLVCRLLLEK